ncbi:MAG TPA: sterol desaturase family protein [Steroidobacteraceae bacterium]|nr:sterol desaturase family protein [Steroidobacteraceae bacterium]
MLLSKWSYYSDFVVYPLVLVALTAINVNHATWAGRTEWLGAMLAGLVLWTFAEYVLHRIALHRMAYFSPMHSEHHAAPLALIGTPSWISVAVLSLVILVPAWLCVGFNIADGLTIGVMFGYWWYGVVHHVIHHHANKPSPAYFNDLRAWHMRHHYSPKLGNFGVTTPLWDHVFGTAIKSKRGEKAAASP